MYTRAYYLGHGLVLYSWTSEPFEESQPPAFRLEEVAGLQDEAALGHIAAGEQMGVQVGESAKEITLMTLKVLERSIVVGQLP